MKRRLVYTTAAREDLRSISDFIADETGSEDVAESFVVGIDARCRRLAELPGMLGTARPELRADLRSTPHRGYLILFRYRPDLVEIVNVLHSRRDVEAYFSDDDH
jgi:plasmid stabilization system protein ParE